MLEAPDAPALARFYTRLLGWKIGKEEPDWATVAPPDGGHLPGLPDVAGVRPAGLARTDRPYFVLHGNICALLAAAVREMVWARADTVVWFDLPRRTVMRQILGRTLHRALTGPSCGTVTVNR